MQDFVVGKTATVIPRLAKQIQFIVIEKTKKAGQPHQLWARRLVVERYAESLLKELMVLVSRACFKFRRLAGRWTNYVY